MSKTYNPRDEDALVEAVAGARAAREPLEVIGGGTKRGLGRPSPAAASLSVEGLTGITLYEPREMVIAARAGTPLGEIVETVAKEGQGLPFEPPKLGGLYGSEGAQTIGAVAACNLSGPARIMHGAARDCLLGIRAVTGRGEAIKSGGRVTKNVTGYDLVKLYSGSHGTLGVLSEVTFKVLPLVETAATLVFEGLDDRDAIACLSAGLGSPYEVTGAAHLPAAGQAPARTCLRIGGFEASVKYRSGALGQDLGGWGSADVLEAGASEELWADIREVAPLAGDQARAIWKVSTTPTRGPDVADAIRSGCEASLFYDWGGRPDMGRNAGCRRCRRFRRPCRRGKSWRPCHTDARARRGPRRHRGIPAAGGPGHGAQRADQGNVRPGPDPQSGPHVCGCLIMQTNFTPEQLRDPAMAASEQILRTCVHCGFCTATCPTYLLLGDELDSPRGRIYLIKDMLENGKPASDEVVKHVDRCLSCLSCMSTCPSGVHYMHLVDHARTHINKTYRRSWHDRLMRTVLSTMLPYPNRFRLSLFGAFFGRLGLPLIRRMPFLARVTAMLELAPSSVPARFAHEGPGTFSPQGACKGRVAILSGCAQPALNPGINEATIRLLTRLGIEVVQAKGEGCCGALVHHMGEEDQSHAQAARNIDAWHAEIGGEGLDAIIITASGCGTTVKDYGFMFRNDAAYADKAAKVSAITLDISEYLEKLDLGEPVHRLGLKIAYHSACSMQHGQQIKTAPKTLLQRAGFKVNDVPEGHICCGSAGVYNIMQPKIAKRLQARKVANIEKTKPQLIATGNIGCMTQIGQATDLPILHSVELIDWAHGGPVPAAIAGLAKEAQGPAG